MRHADNACDAISRAAIARGVDEGTAERARVATRKAMRRQDAWTHRRAEAYFWAVVRRSSVRSRAGRHTAELLVLESVIADLRDSGRHDEAIAGELERGWRGRVCPEALDAAMARLCA